jgi:hypothetical protein
MLSTYEFNDVWRSMTSFHGVVRFVLMDHFFEDSACGVLSSKFVYVGFCFFFLSFFTLIFGAWHFKISN